MLLISSVFENPNISQGSEATWFRRGGISNSHLLQIYCWMYVAHHVAKSHSSETIMTARYVDLSRAWCRASRAEVLMSEQMWWTQVVRGRPRDRCQSGHGGAPSLAAQDVRTVVLTKLVWRMEGRWHVQSDESNVDILLFWQQTIQWFLLPPCWWQSLHLYL